MSPHALPRRHRALWCLSRTALVAGAFCCLHPPVAAAAGADAGGAALDAWLQHQSTLTTWSADVTQVRHLQALVRPLQAKGRVWFQQPNRFRWQLGDPPRTVAVRTGNELEIAYPQLHELERYSYSEKISASWRQVLALLDVGFPSDPAAFHARYQLASATEKDGLWTFRLTPRAKEALQLVGEVRLEVDASSMGLRATELVFPDGSTMRNEFSDVVVNPELDPSLFEIQAGPDWQIVSPLEGK